ncbi:asparaginase [bacterium]|nr:asparaginase [bacterium]
MKEIRLIITGGTFDKKYDPLKGELTFKETHLPQILEQVNITIPIEFEINQLKDSLDMQDECRAHILKACKSADERQIVITHGTDTMENTAAVLGQARLNKSIVLTGAMVPFSVSGSDAMFNLGFALAAVQQAPAGVFIAMNGRILPWNDVTKDKARGRFIKKSEKSKSD